VSIGECEKECVGPGLGLVVYGLYIYILFTKSKRRCEPFGT